MNVVVTVVEGGGRRLCLNAATAVAVKRELCSVKLTSMNIQI